MAAGATTSATPVGTPSPRCGFSPEMEYGDAFTLNEIIQTVCKELFLAQRSSSSPGIELTSDVFARRPFFLQISKEQLVIKIYQAAARHNVFPLWVDLKLSGKDIPPTPLGRKGSVSSFDSLEEGSVGAVSYIISNFLRHNQMMGLDVSVAGLQRGEHDEQLKELIEKVVTASDSLHSVKRFIDLIPGANDRSMKEHEQMQKSKAKNIKYVSRKRAALLGAGKSGRSEGAEKSERPELIKRAETIQKVIDVHIKKIEESKLNLAILSRIKKIALSAHSPRSRASSGPHVEIFKPSAKRIVEEDKSPVSSSEEDYDEVAEFEPTEEGTSRRTSSTPDPVSLSKVEYDALPLFHPEEGIGDKSPS